MDKVYVVLENVSDYQSIVRGVFATLEAAEACVAEDVSSRWLDSKEGEIVQK